MRPETCETSFGDLDDADRAARNFVVEDADRELAGIEGADVEIGPARKDGRLANLLMAMDDMRAAIEAGIAILVDSPKEKLLLLLRQRARFIDAGVNVDALLVAKEQRKRVEEVDMRRRTIPGL